MLRAILLFKKRELPLLFHFVSWCNGSTQDSGPWSLSSNLNETSHGGIGVTVSTRACGAFSASSILVYHPTYIFPFPSDQGAQNMFFMAP